MQSCSTSAIILPGFPTARGADTTQEFTRQRDKIIRAIYDLNADIVGLMEIENDGFAEHSAIADLVAGVNALADLVAGVNALAGDNAYAYVTPETSQIGSDAIAVGILYRPERVTTVGAAKILDSQNSPVDENGLPLFDDTKSRPMLTQSFTELASGQTLVIGVNHLKSKGSSCAGDGDDDTGDGQGNCNLTRTRAAQGITGYLAQQYPQQHIVLLGDYNAYRQEDPIRQITAAGFAEVASTLDATYPYSYVFDGQSGQLDYGFVSDSLLDAVVDMAYWHINTDEPLALDYNLEFKSSAQQDSLYQDTAFRSSDHDPLIMTLALSPANQAPIADFNFQQQLDVVSFMSTASDIDGEIVNWQWDFGDGSQGAGAQINHQYHASGDYLVRLVVTDDQGATAAISQTVTVEAWPEGEAPVAKIRQFSLFWWQIFMSVSTDSDGQIVSQTWQFDDGFTSSKRVVTRRNHQAQNVTLTVTDDDGLTGSVTEAIEAN
nr:ExeM/NucH family extracellular endonuclease [Shewanella sp. NIFS-20-20]